MPHSTAMPQSSFTSGELAPNLYGRVDFAKFYSGLKTCRNMIIQQFGGAYNRPGSEYCLPAKDMTKRVRLVPFQFSANQQYVIEFGHQYLRIIYDGALVVDGGGNPIVITTPFSSSDLIGLYDIDLIKYVQSADVMTICHQSFQPQQLQRTSSTSWALSSFLNKYGPFRDLNADQTQTLTASGVTGTVTITCSAGIFSPDNVGLFFKIQQMPDDVTPTWEVAVPITVNKIRVAGANYYQAMNSATTGTVMPTVVEGTQKDGNTGVIWMYLHSGVGIVQITHFTDVRNVTATVISRLPDSVSSAFGIYTVTSLTPSDGTTNILINTQSNNISTGDTVSITGVTGTIGANGTHTVTVLTPTSFTLDGTSDQTEYTGGGTITFVGASNPTYMFALEAWGSSEGYPMCAGFYQQREIFAATTGHPQTQWYSKVTGYTDFGTSIPLLDDDALTYTLFSRKVNEIRHIVELTSLILFTSDGPFVVGSGKSGIEAITPTSMSVKRQGQNGVSHLPPVLIDEGSLFVQDKGGLVRSLGYSFQQDAFVGQDLTLVSNHLFNQHSIIDWTYQEIPNAVVWCVRDDGVLLGMTYLPKQEVVAWHHHDTDGFYESVCSVTEHNEDVVYASVKRFVNGSWVRYIERFKNRQSFTDLKDCFFLDCGLSYDGTNTTATTVTLSGGTTWDETDPGLTITASSGVFSGNVGSQIQFIDTVSGNIYRLNITVYNSAISLTAIPDRAIPLAYQNTPRTDWSLAAHIISGLGHLEGKTVSVLADGRTQLSQVVVGGVITLEHPGVLVHVGLPYISDFETLEISSPQSSIRDKQQLIKKVTLIVKGSAAVMAGIDFDHLMEAKARQFENYDQTTALLDKTVDIDVPAAWQKAGSVCVRQSLPLPLEILSAIPQVDIGGV